MENKDVSPKKRLSVFDREFEYCEGVPEKDLMALLSYIEFEPDDIYGEGCWLWMGSMNISGYGLFFSQNRQQVAHRAAWKFLRGPIPDGMHLHHKCERPQCVNPNHLTPVTPEEHILKYTPQAITSIQRNQTHCCRGHELSGDNLYVYPGTGHRRCRTCYTDWVRRKADRDWKPRTVRTHCKAGHEYTSDNTYENGGVKYCRVCHEAHMAAYKERLAKDAKPKLSKAERGIEEHSSRKIHCKQGHLLEETRITVGRTRPSTVCGICYRAQVKRNNDKKLAAAHAAGGATRGKNCRRGHDLTDPANVYIHTNGVRECRLCRRIAKDKFKSKDNE